MTVFEPRPYWNINHESSGPVDDDTEVPDGAEIVNCVFASGLEFALFYHAPSRMKRVCIRKQNNVRTYGELKKLYPNVDSENVVFFENNDQKRLESYSFSMYAFSASDFRRLPNGEFVAYETVYPISEKRMSNPIKQMNNSGFQVLFVSDLRFLIKKLENLGLHFGSQAIQL